MITVKIIRLLNTQQREFTPRQIIPFNSSNEYSDIFEVYIR